MLRTILYYGLAMAVLFFALKALEYNFLIRKGSVEIYIGIVALFFTGLGIWISSAIKNRKKTAPPISALGSIDEKAIKEHSISKRELEILNLIAEGNSNQEIAEKLFISLSTVKTHCSNLFSKLDVKRRTQAIQKAKDLRIII